MENAPKYSHLETSLIDLIYHGEDNSNLLSVIAETIGRYLNAHLSVILTGLHNDFLCCEGFWSNEDNSSITPEKILSLDLIESIVLSNEPCLIPDAPQLGQCLAMRLDTRGKPTGILLVSSSLKNFWTEDKQLIFRSAGYLAAIALVVGPQAEMSPSIGFNQGSRNNTGQNSPLVNRLRQLMRRQFEQQRQLNEIKDDIIAAVSDRARNPLATLKMAIDALSDNKRKLPAKSQENYWKIIKHEWNTLNDLINNIIALKQLKSQELTVNLQTVNILELLYKNTESFAQQWREDSRKGLEFVIEDNRSCPDREIKTDPQHLSKILHELLSNAGKFSSKQSKVHLIISDHPPEAKKFLEIKVMSTGLGISKEEKTQIFEPFRRGTGITEQAIAGTGIGLALVKGLVELIDGKVKVDSEPIENSTYYVNTFTVILPRINSNL
ncbi:MAG: HAMP domain-containing histidine kinase [Chlorogloea purpurea SAG 13.99]|jgi:signal transduction histidine kinase|nr:HAMP domain-containing histidine kinase [Chlorogloea purpurea SAG 13.99]